MKLCKYDRIIQTRCLLYVRNNEPVKINREIRQKVRRGDVGTLNYQKRKKNIHASLATFV